MGAVRNALWILAVLCIAASVTHADTYYEKTTIPPHIAATTVLCNATALSAAPTACTAAVVKPLINCVSTFTPDTLATTNMCQKDTLTLSGVQLSAVAYEPYKISITDSYDGRLNTSGDPDAGFQLFYTMAGSSTWAKGRNAFKGRLSVSSSPDATDTSVGGNPLLFAQFDASAGVLNNGTRENPHGQLWVQDNNLILNAGAKFWSLAGGLELDNNLKTGSSVRNHFSLTTIKSSNNGGRGDVVDAALVVRGADDPATNAFGWRTGILFGGPLGQGLNTDSTLIAYQPQMNTTTAKTALMDYGLDLRAATASSGYTAFNTGGTNASGDTYAGNLYTGSVLKAQTATIASIAPAKGMGDLTGGAYYKSASFPTLVIAAPPNSGTRATATVATMGLTDISLTTGTDVGCSDGDVLTLTGGTGTQGTITLTVVSGAATAAVVTTAGSYTAIASTQGSTGGTCSVQPALKAGYGIATTTITNAGTNYLAYPPPYVAVQGVGSSSSTGNIPAYLVPTMSASTSTLTINDNVTIDSAGNITAASFSATGSTAPYTLARSAIPFILLSSATMGNNGALTLVTALPATVPKAYVFAYPGTIGNATAASVTITGTAGQFACTCTGLAVGQYLTLSGTYGGTGSITGYSDPSTYYVSATNGTGTFTLQTTGKLAVVTTAGTPTGITYAAGGGWFYATGSSTTAYTVFNNMYTSGKPTIPASPTSFSTTGAGAYTAPISIAFSGPSYTLTGGVLGLDGGIEANMYVKYNNSANTKTVAMVMGSTNILTATPTTTTFVGQLGHTSNVGSASVQSGWQSQTNSGAVSAVTEETAGASNTASDLTTQIKMTLAAATDVIEVHSYAIEVRPN